MLIKFFESTKYLTDKKIRNPFFGTYILVLLIRNWQLLYSIFNFDNKLDRVQKIKIIEEYISEHSFITGLFVNLLITFLVMIITYIALNLSRIILNYSEQVTKPWIEKLIDSKSVVSKERFEYISNQRNDLQNSLEVTRSSLASAESEIKDRLSQIETFKSTISGHKDVTDNLNRKLTKEIENFQYTNKQKQMLEESNDLLKTLIETHLLRLHQKIRLEMTLDFQFLYDQVTTEDGDLESYVSDKKYLLDYNLVEKKDENYTFSKLGIVFRQSIEITGSGKSYTFSPKNGVRRYLGEAIITRM